MKFLIHLFSLDFNRNTMDYVVGSVAALISGNVTPNRPKLIRRALTPTKHQASPNVTPKSEFVEDRSIFLSPTQQKKKAIVKKSPKRIFQSPDLDVTEDCEGNSSLASPKAEKVKKHLKEELDAEDMGKKKLSTSKSPSKNLDKSSDEVSPKKKSKLADNSQIGNTQTPKKKKRGNSESNITVSDGTADNTQSEPAGISTTESNNKSPKKKQRKSNTEVTTAHTQSPINHDISESTHSNTEDTTTGGNNQLSKKSKKRKKKNKKMQNVETNAIENKENTKNVTEPRNLNKKMKNRKNKTKQGQEKSVKQDIKPVETDKMDLDDESDSEEVKSNNIPNPNAITEKDSDSEHDSDNEIESENEQENEKILTNENQPEESSDEEEKESSSNKKKENNQQKDKEVAMTVEEIRRTLFVGNVPFSSKCKKEIKKIFSKYGQIDTIRIRTIPVKDARVTPKLAIIKNELHPERTTVNVYVKYADPVSVSKAISENNTILNGNHLRVSRSDSTGAEHDSRCAVFVGNLPFAVEDDTLRSKFERCGEITSVRIIRDKKTNAGKGFGYVNFASKDGVELALALSEEDLTIKNRILRVKRCTQQRQGGDKPGGGGKWGSQAQRGKWNNEAQSGANQGKWGSQGQGGAKWGGQNQGGSKWGSQGQGGGKWGNQGQGGGKWGGQGHGGKRDGQGQGGGKWGSQGQGGGKWGSQGQGTEGAARRLMNKRKQQEGSSEAPPSKKVKNVNQPGREKKPRKEFVGMTAEKKKKQKFDKGQKKKRALSEILTKKA